MLKRLGLLAKAASARKGAIQWGYDKGRLIVVQAPGRWANELPPGRWCLLRDTVRAAAKLNHSCCKTTRRQECGAL